MAAKVEASTAQPPAVKVEAPIQTKATPSGTGGTPSSVTSGQTTPAASQSTISKIIAKIVSLFEKIPGLGKLIFEPFFKWINLHSTEVAAVEAAIAKGEGTVIKDGTAAAEAAVGAVVNGVITAVVPGPVGTEIADVTVSKLDEAILVIDKSLETLAPEMTDKMIELMTKIMEKTAGASTTPASTPSAAVTPPAVGESTAAAAVTSDKKPISQNSNLVTRFETALKEVLKHHPHLTSHHSKKADGGTAKSSEDKKHNEKRN